mgnify:CR=1 FL=1
MVDGLGDPEPRIADGSTFGERAELCMARGEIRGREHGRDQLTETLVARHLVEGLGTARERVDRATVLALSLIREAEVREQQVAGVTRKVIPYGAIMYDTKGETWTFTNPAPLTFVRQRIVVQDIEGDQVYLSEGPAVGTAVVTVGAAELMGAEHKYGH